MTRQTTHLVIIDPQKDFMDDDDSALPVPGANADMDRVANVVDGVDDLEVHVTFDSHHNVDVGHQAMWRAADGITPPPPFTAITSDDIRNGIWTPRHPNAKPPALSGQTIRQYMIRYAATLEEQGQYLLMVWPTHCLIGSPGHNLHAGLAASLNRWADRNFANIDWVVKGTNPWTEHYGALQAEVPMPSDPSTTLNTDLLEMISTGRRTLFVGQARTHCVRATITQVADKIDPKLLSSCYIVTDGMSNIPAVPGGPDFPAETDKWQKEMVARGMRLTTTAELLAK